MPKVKGNVLASDMIDKNKWEDVLKGYEGDPYRKEVMIPTIFQLLPNLNGKSVLDAGTGNGILIHHLLKLNPEMIVGVDISKDLLKVARERLPSDVKLYNVDLTKDINLSEAPFDVIICNLVLNDVSNVDIALRNMSKQLKPNGVMILGILHPAYVLSKFCLEGNKNLDGFTSYFHEDKFFEIYKDGEKSIRLEAVFHKISSYLNGIVSVGLSISKIIEPETPAKVIRDNPYYKPYKNLPITMYIVCLKTKK